MVARPVWTRNQWNVHLFTATEKTINQTTESNLINQFLEKDGTNAPTITSTHKSNANVPEWMMIDPSVGKQTKVDSFEKYLYSNTKVH